MLIIVNWFILIMLLVWFAIVVIGLTIKNIVIAEKGYDLITIAWLVLFVGCVASYFFAPSIGQFVTVGFQLVWIVMQSLNFIRPTPRKVANYNKVFRSSHHIIPPSDKYVIPDTAHLILLSLLVLSFVFMLLNIFIG